MHIFQYDSVTSTMDKAQELSKNCDYDNFCVLAQEQQAGKGTHGRIWHSPKGNFYATYVFKKNNYRFYEIGQIALIAGISVAEILESYKINIRLKWSNDLIIDDKKTGGILCTVQDNYMMIGIGINFIPPDKHQMLGEHHSFFPATFIKSSFNSSFFEFAQKLAEQLKNNFDIYNQQGFFQFQQSWQEYSAFYQRFITVQLPDKTIKTGIDNGIDAQGRLIIQSQNGIEYLHSARIIKVERDEYVMMSL